MAFRKVSTARDCFLPPHSILSKDNSGSLPHHLYTHLYTFNKVTQHVSSQALISIHVCNKKWSLHQNCILYIFGVHAINIKDLIPKFESTWQDILSNNQNNMIENIISIIFPCGIVLFSALVLYASHTPIVTLNMHVVQGLCWNYPNKPSSKNM